MYSHNVCSVELNELQTQIVSVLVFYDLFDQPLLAEEIFLNMPTRFQPEMLYTELAILIQRGYIYHTDDYYSLRNDKQQVDTRLKKEADTQKRLTLAKYYSHHLIKLPFVRGVALCSPLAQMPIRKSAEIEFLIITATNRLWMARSFLHAWQQLCKLTGKPHNFSVRTFTDLQHMEIKPRNIFTAKRIIAVMPLDGDRVFNQFFKVNSWTRKYLPNQSLRVVTARPVQQNTRSRFFENLLSMKGGNRLDDLLMKRAMKKNHRDEMVISKGVFHPNQTEFLNRLMRRYLAQLDHLL